MGGFGLLNDTRHLIFIKRVLAKFSSWNRLATIYQFKPAAPLFTKIFKTISLSGRPAWRVIILEECGHGMREA